MIIKAQDIYKSFGTLRVLKGVSLEVAEGEVVAIVGQSGAGKTTFLQILGTLLSFDSGELEIGGVKVGGGERELAEFRCRHLGFVFQSHNLLPEFTALENVCIPSLIAGCSEREARGRAAALLAEVGLEARFNHRPGELSGGEQQRVAIARALVNEPDVVLADEPTGNLDSVTKQEIHELLFSLRERKGQTIVIVTHDTGLAGLCDRCLEMKDGRFVGE